MRRYDRYGDATMSYIYCHKLWSSEKISAEDKEWIDSISTKRILKYSEEKRLEKLYENIFGEKEDFPGGE